MSSTSLSATSFGTLSETRRKPHDRVKNFHHRYLALCRTLNFKPVAELVKRRPNETNLSLDVYCDRFSRNDWKLVAQALSEDRSLQRLALRLRKTYSNLTDETDRKRAAEGNARPHQPAILERRLLKLLIENVSHFLAINQTLESFALEGLPLAGIWTTTLTAGLKRNGTLSELNLGRCSIGDEGCETICGEIKHMPNLQTLNLSACLLTARGCAALADVIKFQNTQRYETSWELSLRYGEIEEAKLFGLKCLALSHNPTIGDGGLAELLEVLKDDSWVRQVHACNCGLTDAGAQMLLECLHLNASIEKFDIRENMEISNEACHEILLKLGQSQDGGESTTATTTGEAPTKKGPKTWAALRERCELYEAQLDAEREKSSHLQSLLAELHLRLGDYAMQMSELQRQLSMLVNERNELQSRLKKAEGRTVSAANMAAAPGTLRKTKSEALPLPYGRGAIEQDQVAASVSQKVVPLSSTPPRVLRAIERSIGDSGHVVGHEQSLVPQSRLQTFKPVAAAGDGLALVQGWGEPDGEPPCVHPEGTNEPSNEGQEWSEKAEAQRVHSISELWETLMKSKQ